MKNIKDYNLDSLKEEFVQMGEKPFRAEQVVHIGDSLSSDIKGASAVGINAIWINRSKREIPNGVTADENLLEVYNTDYFNRDLYY